MQPTMLDRPVRIPKKKVLDKPPSTNEMEKIKLMKEDWGRRHERGWFTSRAQISKVDKFSLKL